MRKNIHYPCCFIVSTNWEKKHICRKKLTFYGTVSYIDDNFKTWDIHVKYFMDIWANRQVCFSSCRYLAIIHPLRPRLTVRVVLAIVVIWQVSIVLAIPNLIYGKTEKYHDRVICLLDWSQELDFGFVHFTDLGKCFLRVVFSNFIKIERRQLMKLSSRTMCR